MTELREQAGRVDRARVWFEAHTIWAVLIIVLMAASSIAFAFHESTSQGARAHAAAERVLNEHKAELHTIAVVAHTSLYRACQRDRLLRVAVRRNALFERGQARAIYQFLGVAVTRAELTARDEKVTAEVRAGAAAAITIYAKLQSQLDTNPVIPPAPPSCRDSRVVPTIAAFETLAKKAAASTK